MTSAARGVDAILNPASVAVIGASDDRSKFGGRLAHILRHQGFEGQLHFITRDGGPVQGQPSHTSLSAVGQHVDVAIMAIPAPAVPDAVDDCAAAGVSSAVIISTGFGELGEEGAALEARLRSTVASSGIRLMGPNCLGAVNAHRRLALTSSVSLAGEPMVAGRVGLISQSGALMVSLIDWMLARGSGLSSAASLGNQLDLEIADFLDHYAADPDTDVVCAYIEGIQDPERFLTGLRRCRAAGKPVVIVKAGRTPMGVASVAAHTASLAGSYDVFRAACEGAGARLVDDPLQMVVIAEALAKVRAPRTGGLAIISTSGGANGVLTDAAAERRIDVARLGEAAVRELQTHLYLPQAQNPVDLGGRRPASDQRAATAEVAHAVAADPAVGVVLLALTSAPGLAGVTETVIEAVRPTGTPVVALSLLGRVGDEARQLLTASGAPCFDRMDDALASIAALLDPPCLDEPAPSPPTGLDLDAIAALEGALSEQSAKALLTSCGIPCNDGEVVADAEAAAKVAGALGFPVVMKVAAPDVVHKRDVGGVILGIADEDAAREAWRVLTARFADVRHEVFVQQQVAGELELLVGAHRDEQFGAVIVVGAGGTLVHVVDDVQLRLAPVSPATAEEMLRGLRIWPALAGARGLQAIDVPAAAETISRLSWIAAALGDRLRDLEINPLIVEGSTGRPVAVDARGVVEGPVDRQSPSTHS